MRRFSNWLLAGGLLCLLASMGLLINQSCQEIRAEAAAESSLVRLEARIPAPTPDAVPEPLPPAEEAPPEILLDGQSYLGILEIPVLGRTLPVQNSWSGLQLKRTPCRYAGDLQGGLVIAGHNYRSHFSGLFQLAAGDEIRLTDGNGTVRQYQVAALQILESDAVEEMLAGDWPLTLFTCTAGGTARLAVRCSRAVLPEQFS